MPMKAMQSAMIKGDPDTDIRTLESVTHGMKGGMIVK